MYLMQSKEDGSADARLESNGKQKTTIYLNTYLDRCFRQIVAIIASSVLDRFDVVADSVIYVLAPFPRACTVTFPGHIP